MSTPEALAGERDEVLRQLDDRTNQMWNAKRKRWAALVRAQAAEIERLTADNKNLRTVMVAAAEEIQAHWDAHCDEDGYGPANLMRRLEAGIPAEYGYTAGAFERLTAERDALREALQQIVDWDGHALNLTATHAKQARAALQQPTEQSNG